MAQAPARENPEKDGEVGPRGLNAPWAVYIVFAAGAAAVCYVVRVAIEMALVSHFGAGLTALDLIRVAGGAAAILGGIGCGFLTRRITSRRVPGRLPKSFSAVIPALAILVGVAVAILPPGWTDRSGPEAVVKSYLKEMAAGQKNRADAYWYPPGTHPLNQEIMEPLAQQGITEIAAGYWPGWTSQGHYEVSVTFRDGTKLQFNLTYFERQHLYRITNWTRIFS